MNKLQLGAKLLNKAKTQIKDSIKSLGNDEKDTESDSLLNGLDNMKPKGLLKKIAIILIIWLIIMGGGAYQKSTGSTVTNYVSSQHVNKDARIIEVHTLTIEDENVPLADKESPTKIVGTSITSFLQNYFNGREEAVEEYNGERPLEDALTDMVELLDTSYDAIKLRIKMENILNALLFDFKIVDYELTSKSVDDAMINSGSMDYAFLISAISILEDEQKINMNYAELKEYINSDSVMKYLCSYITYEAYGYLDEDGNIIDTLPIDIKGKKYIKTIMHACTVKDVFEMLQLNPDIPSIALPSLTNYELAIYRKESLRNTYATYFDFGNSEIDYTLDSEYMTALASDLNYLESGMDIPIYYQGDYPNSSYGTSTVAKSGCGPTSMAMINTYMTGITVTPDVIALEYAKYYVKGSGSSHQLFYAVAQDNEYNCKQLNRNAQEIINELSLGHPVIVTVGKGKFTKGGHIMVIRGFEDGYFLLNDPNEYNYNEYGTDKFQINDIMICIGHAYAFY